MRSNSSRNRRAAGLTIGQLSTYRSGMELRPPSYFALAALIDGPLHGYAIAQRARELSDGRSGSRPERCTRCWNGRSQSRW